MDDAGVRYFGTTAGKPRPLDEELAQAARSDPAAFGILYDRHRSTVFRFLRTRTPTDDDAAELTALTFERALVAMPHFRSSGGGFVAWILRIARNAAIDAGRRATSVPLDDRQPDTVSDALDARVIAAEDRQALAAAIDQLPEVQREAIALRYGARLTAREIGAVIGKSEQATQKLLSRAIVSIREVYRGEQ